MCGRGCHRNQEDSQLAKVGLGCWSEMIPDELVWGHARGELTPEQEGKYQELAKHVKEVFYGNLESDIRDRLNR